MRIRPVTQSDAESICKINDSVKGDKNLHITNSLFMDAESLIENLTALDHMMVLETETEPREICAAVLLIVNRQIFLRRMATLRIIVDPKWQGQGLGKLLMETALHLADDELMMERVEVEIPTDNVNALKLCKSTGFKVEGVAKDFMMTPDGRYVDAYLMAHCRNVK
ncbi:MAG: GNAT family N-acetyltransferase [Cloacibacillus sp.]